MSLPHVQPLGAAALAEARPAGRVWTWLAPLLLTPVVILQLGYGFGEPNHVVYLPWIFRRADPAVLANDWFTNTTVAHPNAVAFVVWLHRFLPLPAIFLALHVLSVWAVLWVTAQIVLLLFGDLGVLLAGLFLLLRWEASLGGNSIWGNCPIPHTVAVPLCLLGLYLVLKERPVAAGAALAAATWVHIQLGALTMLVVGLGLLWRWGRVGSGRIAATGALYLAIAAPTLAAQWNTYMRSPSVLSAADYFYLHAVFRQPHHLVPSSWPGADWYRFLLMLAFAVPAVAWRRRLDRQIVIWTVLIAGLCVAGTVFVEWIPVKLVIRLQTYRLTIFVKYFALFYAARFLLSVVETRPWREKLCALGILTIQNYAAIGVLGALLLALRRSERWLWGLGLFGAGVVAGLALVATTSPGLPMFWHSFGVSPRGLWVAPATLGLLALVVWRNPQGLGPALLSLILLVRAGFGLPAFTYDHPLRDQWVQFCERARDFLPKDAVVITPPFLSGFQMVTQRAEVADWKCTPMVETELVEWKRRLDDLAGTPDLRCSGFVACGNALAGGYGRLGPPDFLHLSRKYGARFVITARPDQHLHGFPELFRLHGFALYRVPL